MSAYNICKAMQPEFADLHHGLQIQAQGCNFAVSHVHNFKRLFLGDLIKKGELFRISKKLVNIKKSEAEVSNLVSCTLYVHNNPNISTFVIYTTF